MDLSFMKLILYIKNTVLGFGILFSQMKGGLEVLLHKQVGILRPNKGSFLWFI